MKREQLASEGTPGRASALKRVKREAGAERRREQALGRAPREAKGGAVGRLSGADCGRRFEIGNRALPIFEAREQILKAIGRNQVSIISGDTGCGKSTQLPLFLYEASLRSGQKFKALCTQPRRLACVNIARRVREEIEAHLRRRRPRRAREQA